MDVKTRDGQLKTLLKYRFPLVDKVSPLEHVRDALAYSESGRVNGKSVIKVRDRRRRATQK